MTPYLKSIGELVRRKGVLTQTVVDPVSGIEKPVLPPKRGRGRHLQVRLIDAQVREIRCRWLTNETGVQIAKDFGITRSYVSKSGSGQRLNHVPDNSPTR